MANSSNNQTTYLIIGAACLAITGLALYLSLPNKSSSSGNDGNDKSTGITPTKSNSSKRSTSTKSTAASTTTSNNNNNNSNSVEDDKSLHRRIEEIDREGKALFKNKEYTAAAECFTKALELIDLSNNNNAASANNAGESNSESKNGLMRQVVTLMNNRSAMYEKGEFTLYVLPNYFSTCRLCCVSSSLFHHTNHS